MIEIEDASRCWQPISTEDLVEGVMRGQYDGETSGRDRTRFPGIHPLTELVGIAHHKEFSRHLLQEVRRVFEISPVAMGLESLEQVVLGLLRWRFPAGSARTTLIRAHWLAAWLAELLGRSDEAIRRYETFVKLPILGSEDKLLTLVARNNCSVLQLRRGEFKSFGELATLAIVEELPSACIGVANILSVAITRFPVDHRAAIFGALSAKLRDKRERLRPKAQRTLLNENRSATDEDIKQLLVEWFAHWLGDNGAERLVNEPKYILSSHDNWSEEQRWLICRLAQIGAMVTGGRPDPSSPEGWAPARVVQELQLWSHPDYLLVASSEHSPQGGWGEFAEAASILYAHEVPDSQSLDSVESWDWELLVRRHLDAARRCLDMDDFDEAQALVDEVVEVLDISSYEEQATAEVQSGDPPAPATPQIELDEDSESAQPSDGIFDDNLKVRDRLSQEVRELSQAIRRRRDEQALMVLRSHYARVEQLVDEACRSETLQEMHARLVALDAELNALDALRAVVTDAHVTLVGSGVLRARLQRHEDALSKHKQKKDLQQLTQRVLASMPASLADTAPAELLDLVHQCQLLDPDSKTLDWQSTERHLRWHELRRRIELVLRGDSRGHRDSSNGSLVKVAAWLLRSDRDALPLAISLWMHWLACSCAKPGEIEEEWVRHLRIDMTYVLDQAVQATRKDLSHLKQPHGGPTRRLVLAGLETALAKAAQGNIGGSSNEFQAGIESLWEELFSPSIRVLDSDWEKLRAGVAVANEFLDAWKDFAGSTIGRNGHPWPVLRERTDVAVTAIGEHDDPGATTSTE